MIKRPIDLAMIKGQFRPTLPDRSNICVLFVRAVCACVVQPADPPGRVDRIEGRKYKDWNQFEKNVQV